VKEMADADVPEEKPAAGAPHFPVRHEEKGYQRHCVVCHKKCTTWCAGCIKMVCIDKPTSSTYVREEHCWSVHHGYAAPVLPSSLRKKTKKAK